MANILQKAASGELKGTEKTDGYNIYLGYVNGLPRAARNKGDMSRGGMTFDDLLNRTFKGGDKAKMAYVSAFNAYEKAINSLSDGQKDTIFGPNGDIFYNAEIQGPVAPNVVNYDENIVNIHHMGHKRYNKDTNQLEIVDVGARSRFLDELVDKFEEITADDPFSVRRTAFLQLNKITDEQFVANILHRIQSSGYSGDMTIDDYLEGHLAPIVDETFPELNDGVKQAIVDKILEKKGATSAVQFTKGLPREEKRKISQFRKDSKFIIKSLIKPIEEPIHDFAVELLRGLESAYILDNQKEVERLKQETKEAITAIRDYEGPGKQAAHDILLKQLDKLKHYDNIDTVVEGFVFQYDGQMYKFTGNFAPINQLLGLFKYGRGSTPPMVKESILEQKEVKYDKKIIAIYPGRFQPMGQHHAEVFFSLLDDPEYDKVYIATSNKVDMTDKDGTPKSPFNFSEKQKIATLYGIDPSQIIETGNPYNAKEITDNFDPEEYRIVYFVGDKDMRENPRFKRTSGITKEGYDWSIEVAPHVPIHIPKIGEMSGTNLRKALRDSDEERFDEIMGDFDPEIYEMIKNKLSRQELEEAQYQLGVFCGVIGLLTEHDQGKDKYNKQRSDMSRLERAKRKLNIPQTTKKALSYFLDSYKHPTSANAAPWVSNIGEKKYYNTILPKIQEILKNVTVEYTAGENDFKGMYIPWLPHTNRIVMELEEIKDIKEYNAVFFHELAHVLDDELKISKKSRRRGPKLSKKFIRRHGIVAPTIASNLSGAQVNALYSLLNFKKLKNYLDKTDPNDSIINKWFAKGEGRVFGSRQYILRPMEIYAELISLRTQLAQKVDPRSISVKDIKNLCMQQEGYRFNTDIERYLNCSGTNIDRITKIFNLITRDIAKAQPTSGIGQMAESNNAPGSMFGVGGANINSMGTMYHKVAEDPDDPDSDDDDEEELEEMASGMAGGAVEVGGISGVVGSEPMPVKKEKKKKPKKVDEMTYNLTNYLLKIMGEN